MMLSKQLTALFALVLILACPAGLHAAETGAKPEVNRDIEEMLRSNDLVIRGVDILAQALLLEVYEGHDFSPFWTRPARIRELMELINDSADHGLIPADYNIDQLQQVLQQRESSSSAEIEAEADILLTESLLRYGYHRRFGKVEGSKLDPDINYRRESFHQQAPTVTIEQAIESSSLADFIEMAAPTGPVYRNLQHQLDLYRDIAAEGGWPTVPEGPTLRLDDQDSRVVAIRRRLAVTGDLADGADSNSPVFDQELKLAVKGFQARHSLDDDGIVGKQSIAAMNVPVETRVDQLRISLERLRWVNQEAIDTLVAVNIAGFRAFVYKDGELEWYTRAMVGKNYRKTPVFRGDIAYLEFNPTWTIPPGILRNDTLPAIKKNPNYLASKNIRVIDRNGKFVDPSTVDWNQYSKGVPYTLRQDPGPNNSLGTVKFIFPNEHFVFLHDTPHRELFSQSERAFSSGCVRIQNPLKLAELLLDDPVKYPRSELEAIVASRETQRINLSPKMPVVIVYLTASVEPGGKVRFYKDVYNRDQKVLDALNGPVIIDVPNS
jgi:murein L,D-transpeptidase YcbB/YkuD